MPFEKWLENGINLLGGNLTLGINNGVFDSQVIVRYK
jgi:hypothetical protein